MLSSKLPKPLQKALPILIIGLTVTVFVYFFKGHPEVRHALAHTNLAVLGVVVALYFAVALCLIAVYQYTLELCGHHLPWRENALLTAYSTIANFFGPLQSGPGVRAVYLKKKHNVKLRDYTFVTLIYYAYFAIISAAFLLVGTAWWFSLLGVVVVAGGSFGFIRFISRRSKDTSSLQLTPELLIKLFLATLIQLALTALIYGIELHATHTSASFRQAISFTGAGNFALFVSLTPGAIGFRETFQAFARRLHHISAGGILAASVVDRAAYLVFLGVLFVLILAVHAKDRLQLNSLNQATTKSKT